MLDAGEAWRLSRTSRRVVVCWDEVRLRTKYRMPRALGAALTAGRRWSVDAAIALLDDACETPFRTRARLLRHFFRHVLTPQQLYRVGHAVHHVATMRLALKLKRKRHPNFLKIG